MRTCHYCQTGGGYPAAHMSETQLPGLVSCILPVWTRICQWWLGARPREVCKAKWLWSCSTVACCTRCRVYCISEWSKNFFSIGIWINSQLHDHTHLETTSWRTDLDLQGYDPEAAHCVRIRLWKRREWACCWGQCLGLEEEFKDIPGSSMSWFIYK